MDLSVGNPFTVLTFIAAPAVLTNACAVLGLTTSNRLARAVDRGRLLVAELDGPDPLPAKTRAHRIHEIETASRRAVLLVEAMTSFQFACGGFAATTVLALSGAALGLLGIHAVNLAALALVLSCQTLAVAGIVRGTGKIIRESRMAYAVLKQEADHVIESFRPTGQAGSGLDEPRPL